jgi:hypothetical protein
MARLSLKSGAASFYVVWQPLRAARAILRHRMTMDKRTRAQVERAYIIQELPVDLTTEDEKFGTDSSQHGCNDQQTQEKMTTMQVHSRDT